MTAWMKGKTVENHWDGFTFTVIGQFSHKPTHYLTLGAKWRTLNCDSAYEVESRLTASRTRLDLFTNLWNKGQSRRWQWSTYLTFLDKRTMKNNISNNTRKTWKFCNETIFPTCNTRDMFLAHCFKNSSLCTMATQLMQEEITEVNFLDFLIIAYLPLANLKQKTLQSKNYAFLDFLIASAQNVTLTLILSF